MLRAAREPEERTSTRGRGRRHQADQPRQGVLAGAQRQPADDQARPHSLLRRRGAVAAAAPQGPAPDADPLPQRRQGRRSFYQKHYEQPIPSFVDTTQIWSGSNERGRRLHHVQQPGDAGLAGPDRRPRAARLDVAARPGAGRARPIARTPRGSEATIDASVLNYPDFMVFDLDPYIYAGHEKGKGGAGVQPPRLGEDGRDRAAASRTCSTGSSCRHS